MQQRRNAESHRPMPSGQATTYQLKHMFVYFGILDLATWAVPSESLQGVRGGVPMAKFTAMLLAAAVLVLSITLFVLAAL